MTLLEMNVPPAVWGVIPAAGSGERMQSALPKQYLPLAHIPVLQRSINTLLAVKGMQGVVVAVQPADLDHFKQLPANQDKRVQCVPGADKRVGSVALAVEAVRRQAGDDAWVLVHDAARPLVALNDIHHLINSVVMAGAIGGLLGTPVQDTLKRANALATSERTVSRDSLWQAQTPQLFRAGPLGHALGEGMEAMTADSRVMITDEASAFERLGESPLLVESRRPNLKITRPPDLELAEALLALAEAGVEVSRRR